MDNSARPGLPMSVRVSPIMLCSVGVLWFIHAPGWAQSVTDRADAGIKWYPGHYMLLPWKHEPARWSAIAENPHFAGGQQIYLWKHLEPEKGRYDFSRIERALEYLRPHGKRLVIEVWDTYFFGSTIAAPDYLVSDPEYKGGIFYRKGTRDGKGRGSIVKRYVPAVMDRYIALTRELGKRFDRDPHVSGFTHTETAMSLGKGSEDFNSSAFHEQMKRLIDASTEAFPTTPVILYGNWYSHRGLEGLRELGEYAYRKGLAWGGPDLCPPARQGWGCRVIREYAGRMASGLAVQWQSYDGRWTAEQLFDCGVNDLALSYIFWMDCERKNTGGLSFRQDVVPVVVRQRGRINTALPQNLRKPGAATRGRGHGLRGRGS